MKPFGQAAVRWGPIILSAAALALLLFALSTGWERGLKDEGAVAHTWQLLMVLQAPLILAFLSTANWRRPRDVARILALQVVAFSAALAPVAILGL